MQQPRAQHVRTYGKSATGRKASFILASFVTFSTFLDLLLKLQGVPYSALVFPSHAYTKAGLSLLFATK
jgi:hypothetical protein